MIKRLDILLSAMVVISGSTENMKPINVSVDISEVPHLAKCGNDARQLCGYSEIDVG
jgi:hypothetical protein